MNKALFDRSKVRDKAVIITMSESEKEFIVNKARENGMTVSAFCRWILIKNLKEV